MDSSFPYRTLLQSARAQVEAGRGPWASVLLIDDKTANKWRAGGRAERTNGEQSAGAPDKQDGFAACMALQHGSFGKCRKRNAQGEVGSGQCLCFGVHAML